MPVFVTEELQAPACDDSKAIHATRKPVSLLHEAWRLLRALAMTGVFIYTLSQPATSQKQIVEAFTYDVYVMVALTLTFIPWRRVWNWIFPRRE